MEYKRYDNEIGNKYGKLKIIKYIGRRATPKNAHVPMVKCICECGKRKSVSLWDLKAGKTKTCGFDHPHYEDRSLPAFNNIYNNSYKGRAIKKGIKFELSKDEFRKICESPCHYCGIKPDEFNAKTGWANVAIRGRMKSGKYISEWKYNGVDRVDPSKGYILKNCVSCCGTCNHAKHTMSYEDFIGWLNRITKFRTLSKD